MGLRDWLIKRIIGQKIKAGLSQNSIFADELLKFTSEKYNRTLRDAEKINRANVISLKEKQLREELKRGLDDEEDGDEDEQDEKPSFEETIGNALINKFLGGSVANPLNTSGASDDGFSQPSNNYDALEENAKKSGITPAQIEEFKRKMGVS